MSAQTITIRSATKKDELKIKDLFFNDTYHWTQWWKPILRYAVLDLFAKPVFLTVMIIVVLALGGYVSQAFHVG